MGKKFSCLIREIFILPSYISVSFFCHKINVIIDKLGDIFEGKGISPATLSLRIDCCKYFGVFFPSVFHLQNYEIVFAYKKVQRIMYKPSHVYPQFKKKTLQK